MLTQHYLSIFVQNFKLIIDLQCCNYCHLPSGFSPNFQSSMTIFHHKNVGFDKLMNLIVIHDNICSLIHKEVSFEKSPCWLTYHIPLIIIFNVVDRIWMTSCTPPLDCVDINVEHSFDFWKLMYFNQHIDSIANMRTVW